MPKCEPNLSVSVTIHAGVPKNILLVDPYAAENSLLTKFINERKIFLDKVKRWLLSSDLLNDSTPGEIGPTML